MSPKNPLIGTRPPTAPVELRAQVLEVLAREPGGSRDDLWDRLWYSRRLRLSWLATLLVLLSLHAVAVPGDLQGNLDSPSHDKVRKDPGPDAPLDAEWIMKLSHREGLESGGLDEWLKLIETLETGS